ncbi:MAG: prepilin-type N-terminal cleavage/methylation domain-containing protein [Candidatus Omnitrophota bacterium]|nr:MAG: prepilin-type N-terminal cleavage/methylation domain-containing protein [Candidatus Omnitrophota bacterium]
MHKEGFTLIELVIGIVLMGVIILAVFSFDIVSREIFRSAERKAIIQKESMFVLDHIQKYVWQGGGNATAPALILEEGENPGLRIRNVTGDFIGGYIFDFTNNEVIFNDGTGDYYLTNRFYNDTTAPNPADRHPFEISIEDGGVRINNFTLMYNPSGIHHYRNNPKVNVKAIYFYPYAQEE